MAQNSKSAAATKAAPATKKSSSVAKGPTGAQGVTEGRGRSKVREGIVVSDKMNKTVVVTVSRREQHPIYKKFVQKTKKYYVHDEAETCNIGDLVRIVETRPMSKLKRWKLVEVVRRAEQGLVSIADA